MGKKYYVVMHYATVYAADGSVDKWSDAVTPTTAGNMKDLMSAVKWILSQVRKSVHEIQEVVKHDNARIISSGDFHFTYENTNSDVSSVRYEVVHG